MKSGTTAGAEVNDALARPSGTTAPPSGTTAAAGTSQAV